MAIKLQRSDWKDGRITVYGTRHTIDADAAGVGPVRLVYEVGRGTYRFLGVERVITNPQSEFAGDLAPLVQSLGSGAVARTAWMRTYKTDQQRRSYYA